MRNAEPLALVGELVIARILWNRGKHRPHQYRQQDRDEADGVSTGKGSPEVRQRWLDDLFHASLCARSSCPRADIFDTFPSRDNCRPRQVGPQGCGPVGSEGGTAVARLSRKRTSPAKKDADGAARIPATLPPPINFPLAALPDSFRSPLRFPPIATFLMPGRVG